MSYSRKIFVIGYIEIKFAHLCFGRCCCFPNDKLYRENDLFWSRLWLIDRIGRRTLLAIGSAGYILSLGLCSYAFFTETFDIVPACIFAFIAAHAVGQGAVIWVLISEIFPNEHRASGQALGSFTHWIFAALLTMFFPKMVTAFEPGYVFGFFCLMMVFQAIWVATMVPETKGVPLEEMEKVLGIRE